MEALLRALAVIAILLFGLFAMQMDFLGVTRGGVTRDGAAELVSGVSHGSDIVFNFSGLRIRLHRDFASTNGLGYVKEKSTREWKVRDRASGQSVLYIARDLPVPDGSVKCDRIQMNLFRSEEVPQLLRDELWTRGAAEATSYPDLRRLTVDFDGSTEPSGRDLPGNPVDRFRLEADALRTSSGVHPMLSCAAGNCAVTMEVQAPLYARMPYSLGCGLKHASAALQAVHSDLRSRIET